MRRKGSYLSNSIVYEYNKRKRYEERKEYLEKVCGTCKNKDKDICDIRLGIDNKWRCVNYEANND